MKRKAFSNCQKKFPCRIVYFSHKYIFAGNTGRTIPLQVIRSKHGAYLPSVFAVIST